VKSSFPPPFSKEDETMVNTNMIEPRDNIVSLYKEPALSEAEGEMEKDFLSKEITLSFH
jgi:hypothetical protein